MGKQQIRVDYPNGRAQLFGRATRASIESILRQWTAPRRPAILVVLQGEAPFVQVFDELKLINDFPSAPIVHVEPIDRLVPGIILVFVVNTYGTTAYAIADPRSSN